MLGIALVTVLCIHIYVVTHTDKPNDKTVAMARIELKQVVTQQEADAIGGWLYKQEGVDHVLCNPVAGLVVFTYYPARQSADQIVSNFKSTFTYPNAIRYLPGEQDLKKGCPVATTSITYKVYSFFRNTL